MPEDPLTIWVCLIHPSYTMTAPANVPPRCNHGIVIGRVLQPCNELMWTADIPFADGPYD